jgi:hypothetical protein
MKFRPNRKKKTVQRNMYLNEKHISNVYKVHFLFLESGFLHSALAVPTTELEIQRTSTHSSRIRVPIYVVREQILFYIGPKIYRFPAPIVMFQGPHENDESRFHCIFNFI